MKFRLFAIFLILLIIFLSGCSPYNSEYVGKLEDEWSEKYLELEEKYDKCLSLLYDHQYALSTIYEEMTPIYLYLDGDTDVKHNEALSSAEKIEKLFRDLGF